MISVGLCSWTEKTLIESGEFYPKEARTSEARLRYYASHFSTVEVDSTYYAIPDIKNASLWAERTPDGFVFHIKAYGALTGHGIDPKTLPPGIRAAIPAADRDRKHVYIRERSLLRTVAQSFREALDPLVKKEKLGLLLFQFPPWFQFKPSRLDYILNCRDLMAGLPVAVEFRHGSWLRSDRAKEVFDFLEKNQITYVTADEPQFSDLSTIPFVPQATGDVAYFRFHGRNRENWMKKGIETSLRFAYQYSEDELKTFVSPILSVSKNAKSTFVMFNNCHLGFAVKNAFVMKELLGAPSQ
ncbi:MAG TPA: DUF72 domain-containing protein [Thermodesulfovibrionales bacterium]|jgi:uncharacterized protein YecE (DUF72 family)|nr:DUF72 domain-containing protein [Thermodesulfovibrionales bacterium]